MDQSKQGYWYALGAVLIWSGFILVSRMGGISALSSHDVIALRYATCALLLLPFWLFWKPFNLCKPHYIICGLIGGLAYALCTFQGFQLAPASHAALLLPGLMPLFIILLSVVINRENQSTNKWWGACLITLGVGLLFWQQLAGTNVINQGDFWFIGGAFCWAVFSVLIKRWNISPWEVTVSLAMVTSVIYLPIYVLFLPKNLALAEWSDIVTQMFYQGFMATILQMILYVRAVQMIGPSSTGAMMAIVPLISGVSALFLFDEPVTTAIVIGLILVATGSAYSNLKTKAKLKLMESQ